MRKSDCSFLQPQSKNWSIYKRMAPTSADMQQRFVRGVSVPTSVEILCRYAAKICGVPSYP